MPLPFLVLLAPPAPEVSVRTMLPQMWEFSHLTRPPAPAYKTAQTSSYDRASDPGPKQDWFANGDAGKFIRVEERGGRKEYVMADLKGPGAVVRVWSANPTGVLRFYFDGESIPRLEADSQKMLTGGDPRFPEPFAYIAARGANLYFPMPYAKSLKVTVDDRDGKDKPLGFYYQVGYRTYTGSAKVRTFEVADTAPSAPEIRQASSHLGTSIQYRASGAPRLLFKEARLQAGGETVLAADAPGTIQKLVVKIPFPLIQSIRPLDWKDPHQPHNILRNLTLRMEFDGKRTVETPLGDFFGSAPGLVPYRSLPFEVRDDGTMICNLPMPYDKTARISVKNSGPVAVPIRLEASRGPRDSGAKYRLHAQWSVDDGMSRPFKDLRFLDTKGEGYWLGSMMHISNPTPAWWGEGDEKIYVDGENFPSTFGTGTEDYYGYAWCSPEVFQRPYHAQPRCDGPANFGQTSVNRFHILDPIPYRKSIRFDMERWHWTDVPATFARVAYWYAKPGGTGPIPIDRRLLAVPEMVPPAPVAGAIEGEKLEVLQITGGKHQPQAGFWGLSSGEQLWWTDVETGNRLRLKISVKEAGTYEVSGNFCHAVDYGIHRLTLAGKDLGRHDFFGTGVEWKVVPLGTVALPAGDTVLEVECLGANAQARPGKMFGLDYIILKKK